MGSRLLVYALTGLLFAAPAADAGSQGAGLEIMDPRAREHLERGVVHYEAKRYEAAIAEFKAGYALEPRRELLFAWAQAERLRGNCAGAVGLYRKVLEQAPSPEQARVTSYHLERCQALVPEPWYRDVVGGVLCGSGAASLGLGVVFIVLSVGTENDAEQATTYRDYRDRVDDAKLQRTLGIAGVTVGAALITGGVLRYVWHGAPEAQVVAEPDRAGLIFTGRF
jgi:hypothetical protein